MNKLWSLLVIPLLLTGFACVSSSDESSGANSLASQIAALTAKDTVLQASIDSVKSDVSNKANKSEIDDLNRKINNLPQSSTPADVATKAIVDQEIADAISALKADQAWITKTGSSNGDGSTGTPQGSVISSNGDLKLYLEKDMDQELFIDEGQAQSFFLSIKNKGTSGTYYRINANFDLAGDVSSIALTDPTTLSCENSSMVTMARSTTIPGTVSGLAFVSQQSGGGTKIWIGKNTTLDLILVLKINYTDPAVTGKLWTWDFSIRQLN